MEAIDRFGAALANEAKRRGLGSVVRGHIHHTEMREVGAVPHINDGKPPESRTALV